MYASPPTSSVPAKQTSLHYLPLAIKAMRLSTIDSPHPTSFVPSITLFCLQPPSFTYHRSLTRKPTNSYHAHVCLATSHSNPIEFIHGHDDSSAANFLLLPPSLSLPSFLPFFPLLFARPRIYS
eukprot:TRINITY_DN5974_c0_g1_i2.p1 TRINITY_DN5974_c0_g1~~TRINITY_DN5974_c0_g1_i2.p1  ORF type:complete len:124 (+),score=2.95 TRINITY_DN5974_c0_g1_i2:138-509(+)